MNRSQVEKFKQVLSKIFEYVNPNSPEGRVRGISPTNSSSSYVNPNSPEGRVRGISPTNSSSSYVNPNSPEGRVAAANAEVAKNQALKNQAQEAQRKNEEIKNRAKEALPAAQEAAKQAQFKLRQMELGLQDRHGT